MSKNTVVLLERKKLNFITKRNPFRPINGATPQQRHQQLWVRSCGSGTGGTARPSQRDVEAVQFNLDQADSDGDDFGLVPLHPYPCAKSRTAARCQMNTKRPAKTTPGRDAHRGRAQQLRYVESDSSSLLDDEVFWITTAGAEPTNHAEMRARLFRPRSERRRWCRILMPSARPMHAPLPHRLLLLHPQGT